MYGTNIAKNDISIHAPREGGDKYVIRRKVVNRNFNPRPPRGGRLDASDVTAIIFDISIHAPREGGDDLHILLDMTPTNFNPRPPRGGRLPHIRH